MFAAEQTILDEYNARYPALTHYRLVRVSKLHPTAHIAPVDGTSAVCGTDLYRGFEASVEGATNFCGRCRRTLDRRLS